MWSKSSHKKIQRSCNKNSMMHRKKKFTTVNNWIILRFNVTLIVKKKLNENCSLSTKYPYCKVCCAGHHVFLEHILEWTFLEHILAKMKELILIVNWNNNQPNIIRNDETFFWKFPNAKNFRAKFSCKNLLLLSQNRKKWCFPGKKS